MKKWNIFRMVIAVVTLIGFTVGTAAFAEGIKDRMRGRLPELATLKAQGIIGENNKGYLEFVGKKIVKREIIEAENSDREKVYRSIAKQQGTTVEVVGSLRAGQIAENAKAGEWLQDKKGNWFRK